MNIRPLMSGQVDQFLPDFVTKVNNGEIDPLVDHVLVFTRSAFAINDLRAALPAHLLSAMELRSSQRVRGVTGWYLPFRAGARSAVVAFLAPELPSTIAQGSMRFRRSVHSTGKYNQPTTKVYFGPSTFLPDLPLWRVNHFDGPFDAGEMVHVYLEHLEARLFDF